MPLPIPPAQAAYEAAVATYPDKRICLRQTCRVICSSDQPRGDGMSEARLDIAERHVREAQRIVERQERLIAETKSRGKNTRDQEFLLDSFRQSLTIFEADLAALRKEPPAK